MRESAARHFLLSESLTLRKSVQGATVEQRMDGKPFVEEGLSTILREREWARFRCVVSTDLFQVDSSQLRETIDEITSKDQESLSRIDSNKSLISHPSSWTPSTGP
ncbi:hypothetical protein GC173_06555 [bacterium]|nr:hypothetical protein [bacterium]